MLSLINIKKITIIPIFLVFMYSNFATTLFPTYKFITNYGCLNTLECKSLIDIRETIRDASNYDKVNVVYGNGWVNILSKKTPSISILNWPIIGDNKINKFYKSVNNFEKIIAVKNQTLWIEKSIYDKFKEEYDYLNINILNVQGIYYKVLLN
jgi:hypothetical protein